MKETHLPAICQLSNKDVLCRKATVTSHLPIVQERHLVQKGDIHQPFASRSTRTITV